MVKVTLCPLALPATDIQVLQSTGKPAENARVLFRDRDATLYLGRLVHDGHLSQGED
jgi:hypothetical protein